MQQTTTALTIEAGKVGCAPITRKCKFLTTTVWNDRKDIQATGSDIDKVDDFCYHATLVATYRIMAVAKRTSEFATGKQQQCLEK